ncbi:ArsR/SmtB family transcription factor [Actinomadura hibisca]|uniref:ArsR/SmtB family transcription factor n=1 Tax=Actinomadura hibisca TaxID=68565 RepID=UPI0008378DAD|nr:ArsR family transcriptional regulator [Actinomadura hibisca]
MLRILFTPEDLAGVRVAAEPDFLWEVTGSVRTLRRRDGARVFGEWRRQVRHRLPADARSPRPLLASAVHSPEIVGAEAPVETLTGIPNARLPADLGRPPWLRRLADGDPDALRLLGHPMRAYHAAAVAPFWGQVRSHVHADRTVRMRALLDGGVHGLLASLGPRMRWRPPVLEADHPADRTVRLDGRGLLLQPAFFCWPTPVPLADPERPPVLVYPVEHEEGWASAAEARARRGGRADPLGALIGGTRAALLRAAYTGCTTGELARLLEVTAPAVSQHASVLRDAGLLSTVRRAGYSLHTTTVQGRALLRDCAH